MNQFDKYIERAKANGSTGLARRIGYEKQMAEALVDACLQRGFSITVDDGEEFVILRSVDRTAIMESLCTVEADHVYIHDAAGSRISWFYLIYGNSGYDVVADYAAANTVSLDIWDNVLSPLANKIEAELHG